MSVPVQIKDHGVLHSYWDPIRQVSNILQIPRQYIVMKGYQGPEQVTVTTKNVNWNNITHWKAEARPIVGDHIHATMSIYIDGQPVQWAEHDRYPIEPIPYESGKPHICKADDPYAYYKIWPHSGVHTHCDGLIHIHPWSAPRAWRKEGVDIKLGLWFDAVGIVYRESPLSLQMPDGQRYTNNDTHKWHLLYWPCPRRNERVVRDTFLDQVWIGYAYAHYILAYGRWEHLKPIASHIRSLAYVGAHGFNGEQYPIC